MALDTEEQQLVEEVKKWIAQNGLFMIVAIALSAAALFGYQKWRSIHESDAVQASTYYEQLLNDLSAKNAAADQSAQYLIKQYPHNTYTQLAELLLAKRAIEQGLYGEAERQLMEVINHSHLPALREIARLRIARIYIQIKQPRRALDILKQIDAKTYQADIKAVQGDAYVALNNTDAARAYYQQALSGLPDEAILHSLVSMKLNNLA